MPNLPLPSAAAAIPPASSPFLPYPSPSLSTIFPPSFAGPGPGPGQSSSATSPFNVLTATAQSPFLPFGSVQQLGATPATATGMMPLGTPGPSTLGLVSRAGGGGRVGTPSVAGLGQGGAGSGAAGVAAEIPVEVALQAVDQALAVLSRLEEVLLLIQRAQLAVFATPKSVIEGHGDRMDGAAAGGMEVDNTGGIGVLPAGESVPTATGDPAQLSALQQEYTQLILALQPLLASTPLGSLPSPLSSATPPPPSAGGQEPARPPSMREMTAWAEERAQLEFSRREGVRVGAKAVLDVFKSR